jgi:predicted MFS family arabinose efflux permease
LINLPIAALVLWASARHVPETRDPGAVHGFDLAGTVLAAMGLAGVIYALTEGSNLGWTSWPILLCGIGGVLALIAMIFVEAHSPHPLLSLKLFKSPQFNAANLVTLLVYAALGGSFFLLPVALQGIMGLSPIQAGASLLPVTFIMLALSAKAGRLSQQIGPRLPMTLGPIVAGAGLALLARLAPDSSYLGVVVPAVVVFGLGLSLTVAPLTATVLAAVSDEHAGAASAVNNDISRVGGLIAVATLPQIAGISGYIDPVGLASGFRTAMLIAGGTAALGGVIAFLTIRRPAQPEEAPARYHCAIDGSPLHAQLREEPALSSSP